MNTLTKTEEAAVLKMRSDEFNTLTKGIPNYIVARLLTKATPGVCYTGGSKALMRDSWVKKEHSTDFKKFAALVKEWREEEAEREAEIEKNAIHWKIGDVATVFDGDRLAYLAPVTEVSTRGLVAGGMAFRLDGSRDSRVWYEQKRYSVKKTTQAHRDYFAREEVIGNTLKEARRFLREDFPDGRIARYRPTGEVQKGNPPIPMYEFAGWEDG
jgi:hypothetical protein